MNSCVVLILCFLISCCAVSSHYISFATLQSGEAPKSTEESPVEEFERLRKALVKQLNEAKFLARNTIEDTTEEIKVLKKTLEGLENWWKFWNNDLSNSRRTEAYQTQVVTTKNVLEKYIVKNIDVGYWTSKIGEICTRMKEIDNDNDESYTDLRQRIALSRLVSYCNDLVSRKIERIAFLKDTARMRALPHYIKTLENVLRNKYSAVKVAEALGIYMFSQD